MLVSAWPGVCKTLDVPGMKGSTFNPFTPDALHCHFDEENLPKMVRLPGDS